MKKFKNESGAALILTVMIITLLMVGILGLFTQVTNTTKQITTMEKEISAQLIAEMGIDYYRALIEDYVNDNEFTDSSNLENLLLKPEPISLNPTNYDSSNHTFEIINPHIVEDDRTENSIPIRYTVVGTAYEAKHETIDTITITINSESGE